MSEPSGSGAVLDGAPVDLLPQQVADRLAARAGADHLTQVRAAGFKERSANAWFRGTALGREVFVKLYARNDRAATERLVAPAVGPGHSTRLLDGGTAAGLGAYAVFGWEDLHPLRHTADSAATAGRLLAAVHDTVPPPDIVPPTGTASTPQPASCEEQLETQWEALAGQAPDLYALVRDRPETPAKGAPNELAREADRRATGAPRVLLHGDYSLRNVARGAGGREVVFDFERAALGPFETDLQRLWDRELAALPAGRAAFTAAYRGERGTDPGPPDPVLLDFARLSCALSTLTAARRTDDPAFEAEGLAILKALR
ncbi:aminoglycoside phosphotransferase family protein [Streptomyces sp. XM4193]|uniref:aminoglycoside phosphotransferase family protein n=1 Tax=Streptomyces sp. XM4193 TaxID=2929782 RepID=UPI001FFBA101|nr:aminoglycoside phosphotransferase family protein [Streptomyces sp. XM4193]MCK1798995.1 aminoglycoside phosphotransferase family protein [Streptomyces sp. XM4193]